MSTSGEYRLIASASHSHLFPGAILRIAVGGSGAIISEPFGLTIAFPDGVVSQAELVLAEDGADADPAAAVIVNAYTTLAGTVIPEKIWSVAEHTIENGSLNLRIGRQIQVD
jgi:hypothetical protein